MRQSATPLHAVTLRHSVTLSNPPLSLALSLSLSLLLRVSRLSGPYVGGSEGGETLHSPASQPVHFIHPGEAFACPIRQHYNAVIVINELPSLGPRRTIGGSRSSHPLHREEFGPRRAADPPSAGFCLPYQEKSV